MFGFLNKSQIRDEKNKIRTEKIQTLAAINEVRKQIADYEKTLSEKIT